MHLFKEKFNFSDKITFYDKILHDKSIKCIYQGICCALLMVWGY